MFYFAPSSSFFISPVTWKQENWIQPNAVKIHVTTPSTPIPRPYYQSRMPIPAPLPPCSWVHPSTTTPELETAEPEIPMPFLPYPEDTGSRFLFWLPVLALRSHRRWHYVHLGLFICKSHLPCLKTRLRAQELKIILFLGWVLTPHSRKITKENKTSKQNVGHWALHDESWETAKRLIMN